VGGRGKGIVEFLCGSSRLASIRDRSGRLVRRIKGKRLRRRCAALDPPHDPAKSL
jgi:hypothetical protein